jgi:mono/diheme cytochrome c family protein
MRRGVAALAALIVAGVAAFWVATMPRGLPASEIAALGPGDPAKGETWFWAGGCAGCHAAAKAEGEERLKLGGGQALATPFGRFVVPNISNDPDDGIGKWSAGDLANAMLKGVTPGGQHLYPAFPYPSYARMKPADVADLRAYLATLPAVAGRQPGHELRFPFAFRRGIGLWKLAFLRSGPVVAVDGADPVVARGQYLVEGPGHCGECHTPRNFAGGLDLGRWLAGAPNPAGKGRVPNITPGEGGIGEWSAEDIAYFLETGFTPDYDSVGGSMVEVQANMAMLGGDDRAAIAAYLKAVPPQASAPASP